MNEKKSVFQVTQSSIRAPPQNKSSVCLREVRITLDKSIVHNYPLARSTNSSDQKNMKQTTLVHYFKANEISDICKSNKTEAVVGNRQSFFIEQFSNTSIPNNTQIQNSINNVVKFGSEVKAEPIETQSTNKAYPNECRDFIEHDYLDIGKEFKYRDFLSRSKDTQLDVLNARTAQKNHVKIEHTRTERSLTNKKQIKTLQCNHCGLRTPQKEFLQNHIKSKHSEIHDESGFITCFKCNKKYMTFHGFKAHERVCGTKFYYPCKFCQKMLVYCNMKSHLVNQHTSDFDKRHLNEIIQWCKSKRIRKAASPRKRMKINEKLLLKHSELNKLVKMFCSKCDLSLELEERKPMVQCLKCKTALKLQCYKCKKTYSNAVSAMTHVRRLCKYKENNSEMETNKEAFKMMIFNDNRDVDDELDIGEEFKYSEYLSSSENVQMNIVNKTATVQEFNGEKKSKAKITTLKPIMKPFQCHNCGHRTQKKSWLESHIKHKHSQLYDENGIITCDKCDKKYKTLSMFNFHKRSCGTKYYLPCKFCSKLLTAADSLKKHVFSQHEKEIDGESFNEILQWSKSKAVRKATNQGRFINAHLPTKKNLIRSYFDLNKLIKMHCSKCNVTSERELGKIKIQCLKCDTALVFQCQMCKKTYDKRASLYYHIRWYCKEKGDSFNMTVNKIVSDIEEQQTNNSNPKNFLAIPYKKNIKYFYCSDCDYKSDAKPKLIHHIRFYHNEGRSKKGLIICPKCRMKFNFSREYEAHQLVCIRNY